MKPVCTAALFAMLSTTIYAQSADNMKAFPPAEKGMIRYVVQLPKQDDESALRIELIAGKTVQLDQVNHYFFGGKIEAETIQGWGYTRYVLAKLGPMAGTKVGVPPDAPTVDRFVTLGGEPNLIRYNSRLPLVVYVPEGVELKYRVWTAEPKTKVAEKG